jgi:hypothetical protein
MGEVIWLLAKSLHERGALAFITWSGVFVFLFFCNLDLPHPHFLENKKMIQRYFMTLRRKRKVILANGSRSCPSDEIEGFNPVFRYVPQFSVSYIYGRAVVCEFEEMY